MIVFIPQIIKYIHDFKLCYRVNQCRISLDKIISNTLKLDHKFLLD